LEVYDLGYHPIESLMRTTMDSLKDMVDVNTVVGEPVETKEGTVIIPVSRVSFGFVTGGGDEAVGPEGGSSGYGQEEQGKDSEDEEGRTPVATCEPMPFTGGTGAGVSVRPVGFLVVGERKVRFLPVDSRALLDRLLEEAPELLDRFAGAFGRRRDDDDGRQDGERDEHRRGDRRDRHSDLE
jgi:sporulation protein YtfJ